MFAATNMRLSIFASPENGDVMRPLDEVSEFESMRVADGSGLKPPCSAVHFISSSPALILHLLHLMLPFVQFVIRRERLVHILQILYQHYHTPFNVLIRLLIPRKRRSTSVCNDPTAILID